LSGIDTYLSLIAPKTPAEAEAMVAEKLEEVAAGKAVYFSIIVSETQEFAGICGIFNLGTDVVNRHAWIRKDFQGKGYAFEAISELMRFAEKNLNYDVIYSAFDDANLVMKQLNKKLGGIPSESPPRPVRQESGKVLNITYYSYPHPSKQKSP
jgi:RimJ/RimL family protein N-acetyltransferase